MQILFICHRIPYPPNKGDKIRSFAELRALSEKHQVDLFCLYDDPDDAKYIPELGRYCRHLSAEPMPKWKSLMETGWSLVRGEPLSMGHFRSRKLQRDIQHALATTRYDMAVAYSSSMAQYLADADVPKVMDMVDVDSDKWRQYAQVSGGLTRFIYRLESDRLRKHEQVTVSAFDCTIVSTNRESKLLDPTGLSNKVAVLENSIDTALFDKESGGVPPSIAQLQPYVIFCGQMDYLPNVDAVHYFCRDIWPLVQERWPELKFVIAGRSPSNSVKQLVSNQSIVVTGTVPDMRPYLRAAMGAVVPLRIACGIQNKILEALAIGIRVIASRRSAEALPAALRELVCAADEPISWAREIVALRNGEPDQNRISSITAAHCARAKTVAGICDLVDMLTGTGTNQRDVAGISRGY